MIRQALERTLSFGHALERERDGAVQRAQLRAQKAGVDRLARQRVAEPELRRRQLLDELDLARALQRGQQRLDVGAERLREQRQLEGAPDDGGLRDDSPIRIGERAQALEQRRAYRRRQRAIVRRRPGAATFARRRS